MCWAGNNVTFTRKTGSGTYISDNGWTIQRKDLGPRWRAYPTISPTMEDTEYFRNLTTAKAWVEQQSWIKIR
jgi:hypothetical protein